MKRMISLALAGTGAALAGCAGGNAPLPRNALVAEPEVCGPQRFDVYFEEGQARLTQAALQAIGLAATALQGCDIRSAHVLGLADASGGDEANMTLSRRRAEAVAAAFASTGWPAPVFDLASAGERGADADAPLRRRAEVLVDAVAR